MVFCELFFDYFSASWFGGSFGFEEYKSSLAPSRVITVTAQDKKAVIPDIASFSFSVVSEGKDPAKIADDNNKIMNRAIGVIKPRMLTQKTSRRRVIICLPVMNMMKKLGLPPSAVMF